MRYLLLVLLNLPIILLALVNIVTQYKLGQISKNRFRSQLVMWLIIMVLLIGSFPFYNYLRGRPPLDSINLSSFDIIQTTAIVLLFYIVNSQRQRVDQIEHRLRNLHQELSIKLSGIDEKKR